MTTLMVIIKMPTQKEKIKPDLDSFLGSTDLMKEVTKDLPKTSLQAMVDAGEILTTLTIELNKIYRVKVTGIPSFFDSQYGQTMKLPIEYETAPWTLIIPKSLKIQLIADMIRKNIKSFNELIGNTLVISKAKGSTKQFKDAKLYRCYIELVNK